jgi:hypothetical protein
MKLVITLSLVGFFASLLPSRATTVTFSGAAGNRTVVDASSTQLSSGDLVWVGTFSSESFSFNPALSIAANISAIESAGGWDQFTLDTSTQTPDANITNTVTINSLAGGGHVAGQVTDNNSGATKADFFNGSLIYVWVFNASTTGAATQMGIFRAGTGAGTVWKFPNNANGVGDSTALTTNPSLTPSMVAIGGAGTVQSGGAGNMQLAAAGVPEPSTIAALFSAGGLLLLVRRRPVK